MPDRNRTDGDDPKPIADAASLFDTGEIPAVPPGAKPAPPAMGEPDLGTDEIRVVHWAPPAGAAPPPEAPTAADLAVPFDPDDGYGLIGGPDDAATAEEPPRPVDLPKPEKRVRRPAADAEPAPTPTRSRATAAPDDEPPRPRRRKSAEVQSDEDAVADPLWTRWGEWGGTVIRVGMAGLATLVLAYILVKFDAWGLAALAVLAGGAVAVLLSYPILVTMERPVRITPEQAVKDFYAAASHHFPQYQRMWLLLSSAGRDAGPFRSFGDFESAWKARVAAWKGSRVKKYAPLDFQVQDFRADKSVGQTTVWAEYTLRVRPRDATEVLGSIRMAHGLVKGDDRMWYLNRGLPPARNDGD